MLCRRSISFGVRRGTFFSTINGKSSLKFDISSRDAWVRWLGLRCTAGTGSQKYMADRSIGHGVAAPAQGRRQQTNPLPTFR